MPEIVQLGFATDAATVIRKDVQAGYDAAVRVVSKPLTMRIDSRPLGTITGDIKELDKSLAASNARVIAFGATTGVLFGIAEGFRALVRTTIDVEKELTNIQSILHLSNQSFASLKSTLFDIAGTTASSFKEVTEVATNFARQGLGMTETLKRTRDALILARETGIDAKEAFSSLTAAVNTFRGEALDSTTIINKLVAVSTNFAVTSGDLAEALKRAGATAQESKVNFDQLVGAITAIQTATGRGGAVIGTALQRIFARVESGPTLKALDDIGVRTRELSGDIRPALDILTELAGKFQSLNEVQRNQISTALAGRIQFNQLNSLLRDLARQNSVTAAATEKSSGATDEAIRRNNELNTSLSALINKAKESGAALASAFGEKAFDPAARGLVTAVNKIFDSLKNTQGNDSVGAKIGGAIVQGIGSAIKGPGTVIVSALLLTLFARVTGYATKAIAELTGLNKNAKDQQNIEASINQLLQTGNREYVQRYQTATTVKEQEAALLALLKEQNVVLQSRAALSATFQEAGFSAVGGRLTKEGAASGYIPTASSGLVNAVFTENNAIRRGVGGASPSARSVVVPSFNFGGGKTGQIVANTNEYIVKNFAGGQGSAVFNPQMISAVGGFNKLQNLGRVERVANRGLIPNYAAGNIDNLLKLFMKAKGDPEVYQMGMQWYPEAREFSKSLAGQFGVSEEVGAGVISALSAQNEWARNKKEAGIVFTAKERGIRPNTDAISSGLNLSEKLTRSDVEIQKAYKIINQKAIGDVLLGDRPGRYNKQGNFAANILGHSEYRGRYPVTIDTWATHAWLGDRGPTMVKTPGGTIRTPFEKFKGQVFQNSFGLYHTIGDDYRTAARQAGVSPENFQAVVWSQIRKDNPQYIKNPLERMRTGELPFAGGYMPHLAEGFPTNLFGLKDILSDPKGTLQRLPFRVGGTIAAGLAGAGIKYFGKHFGVNPLESEQFFSASRYLSGLGGTRRLKMSTDDISKHVLDISAGRREMYEGFYAKDKSADQQLRESYANRLQRSHFRSPFYNVIGDFTPTLTPQGKFDIKDDFDFDNSLEEDYHLDEKRSKSFHRFFQFGDQSPKIKSLVNRLPKDEYKFGPISAKIFQDEERPNIILSGLDLDFAKYGNPFTTHIQEMAEGFTPYPEGMPARNWSDETWEKKRQLAHKMTEDVRASINPAARLMLGNQPKQSYRIKTRLAGHQNQYHTLEIFTEGQEKRAHTSKDLRYLHGKIPAGALRMPESLAGGYTPEFPMKAFKNIDQYGGTLDWKTALRYINPKQFLHSAYPLYPNVRESQENIAGMREAFKSGVKFDPLYLRLGEDEDLNPGNFITAHEGRHRASAAIEEGISKVPVLFDVADYGRVPELAKSGQLNKILGKSYFSELGFSTRPDHERWSSASPFNFLKGPVQGQYAEGYTPQLDRLNEMFGSSMMSSRPALEIDGKTLKVNQIFNGSNPQTGKNSLLYLKRLIQESGINEIKAGWVTGPKMIPAIDHLRRDPELSHVKISGQFSPLTILEQSKWRRGIDTTPKHTSRILQSFKNMGVSSDFYNRSKGLFGKSVTLAGGYIPSFAEPPLGYINELLNTYQGLNPQQQAARKRYAVSVAQEMGLPINASDSGPDILRKIQQRHSRNLASKPFALEQETLPPSAPPEQLELTTTRPSPPLHPIGSSRAGQPISPAEQAATQQKGIDAKTHLESGQLEEFLYKEQTRPSFYKRPVSQLLFGPSYQTRLAQGFQSPIGEGGIPEGLEASTQRELLKQQSLRRSVGAQRRQQGLIGAAIAAPIVAPAALEAFGVNSESGAGKIATGLVNAASTGATVAAFGGGPVLGGLTAGFLALRTIVTNTAKSFDEVSKAIDESNHKKQEEASYLEAANQALGNLADIRHQGGDPRAVNRATRQTDLAIQQVPAEFRRQFAEAAGAPTEENLNKIADLTEKFNEQKTRNEQTGEVIKRLTLTSQQTRGAANVPTLGGLYLPSQATTEAAFQPGSGFGGYASRFLYNVGTGRNLFNSVGLNPFRSPSDADLKTVRENAQTLSVDQFKDISGSLNSIPIPEETLKSEDFGKQLRSLRTGDNKEILQKFFEKIGIDPKLLKQEIDALPKNDIDANLIVGQYFRNAQQLQTLAKKVEESQKKTNLSFRDFLNISDDILKDVAHNFDIQGLKDSADRNIGLKRAEGLLQIASPTLTPTGIANFQFQNQAQGIQNEQLDNINKRISDLIGKFNVSDQALESPKVQTVLGSAAASISQSPANILPELTKLGEAIATSGATGGDKIKDNIIKASKQFARDLEEENEKYIIKYKEANEEHALSLTKIQVEQQRNLLGGDFTKLGPSFKGTLPILQGLSGLNQIDTSRISGVGNADRLTGFEPVVSNTPPEIAAQQFKLSPNLFREGTGPGAGLPVSQFERSVLARRSSAITGLGDQLQSLGLLDQEPQARQKFADIASQGGLAQGNNFLNLIKQRAAAFGQADLVQLINRRQNSPEFAQSFRLQADERYKTGEESGNSVTSLLKQQIDYNAKLGEKGGNKLDPVRQNTLALLNNKKSIEDLTLAIHAYQEALSENKQTISDGKTGTENSDEPNKAKGFVPNFNAFTKELKNIRLGVGGARSGDKPYFTNINGLGSAVVNSGESIIRNFMDSGKDAVFNRNMEDAVGLPLRLFGNVDRARGYVPNFDDIQNQDGSIVKRNETINDLLNQDPTGMAPTPTPAPKENKSWWKKFLGLSRGYVPNFDMESIGVDMLRNFFFGKRKSNLPHNLQGLITNDQIVMPSKLASELNNQQFGRKDHASRLESADFAKGYVPNFEDDEQKWLFRILGGKAAIDVAGKLGKSKVNPRVDLNNPAAKFLLRRLLYPAAVFGASKLGTDYLVEHAPEGYRRDATRELGNLATLGLTGAALGGPYVGLAGIGLGGASAVRRGTKTIYDLSQQTSRNISDKSDIAFLQQGLTDPILTNQRILAQQSRKLFDLSHKQEATSATRFTPADLLRPVDVFTGDPTLANINERLGTRYDDIFGKEGPFDPRDVIGQTLQGVRQYQMNQIAQGEGYRNYQQLNRFTRGGTARTTRAYNWSTEVGTGAFGHPATYRKFNHSSDVQDILDSGVASKTRKYGWKDGTFHYSPEAQSIFNSGAASTTRSYGYATEVGTGAFGHPTAYRKFHYSPEVQAIFNSGAASTTRSYGWEHGVFHYSPEVKALMQGSTAAPRFDQNLFGYAGGYIPNFNQAISEAIVPEASALRRRGVTNPHDYIFMGESKGILGVGNTLDENQGIYNGNAGIEQGVNRYLRAGRNPRTAGSVPNYAAGDDNSLSKSIDSLIQKLSGYFDKSNTQVPTGSNASSTGEVQHTGNFNVDVNLGGSGAGSNGVDSTIQQQVQQALAEFKADLEKRLASLEKANGQFTPPPNIGSNLGAPTQSNTLV